MPRKQSPTLTEAELRLMNVLWQKGSATVHEIQDALSDKPALAYNSVLTTVRVLEKKGYVKHVEDGRAHVYEPRVDQNSVKCSEIRHLVGRLFKDSHAQLVLSILEDQTLDTQELNRLRQLLERSK